MKYNREFEIAWQGLKLGLHTFVYDIDDKFVEKFNHDSSFSNWNATVTLKFDKHENFFMLHFDVGGEVTVPCDRCGDDFRLKLWDEFDLVIKLMNEETEFPEEEDDVAFIPRSETVIDVSGWVYEFLMLSVPLQHIHPDHPDGSSGCNPEALSLLDKLAEPDEPVVNPIWKDLEKIKNKN